MLDAPLLGASQRRDGASSGDISHMEPDDEPVIGNPMSSRTSYTPPPARTSSPDPRVRSTRYSLDGVIDKQVRGADLFHEQVLCMLYSAISAMC
jgi:hypothetical protein